MMAYQPPLVVRAAVAVAAVTLSCSVLSASAASITTARPAAVTPVGVSAIDVAVDPATDTGYSWAEKNSPVEVIDLATGVVTASITVPAQSEVVHQVLAVDPDTDTVYLANYDTDSVVVIDGATNSVTQTITGVVSPTAITVDPATDTVFVAQRSGGIAVIDGATGAVTGSVPAGEAVAMAVDPSTDTIYAGEAGTIQVIDGATDSVTASISGYSADGFLADDPGTDTLYAGNSPGVTIYSGRTNKETGSVTLPDGGFGVAVDDTTDTVFAAVPAAGELDLISGSADDLADTLALAGADQIAADPQTDTLLVIAGGETYLVALQAPDITSTGTSATFTVGEQKAVTLAASGTPAPHFTESGALPAGLQLTAGGALTGTPSAGTAGDYRVSITAANGVNPAATEAFQIVVNQRPAFVSAGRVVFRAGARQRFTVRTSGAPVPTVTEKGTLPKGLRFTKGKDGTAVISGRAARSAAGKVYTVTLSASNNVGEPVTQRLRIRVR
jgi:YVTN family beta-propeller protein